MSTRANIRIKDGDELIQLYHHSDGDPECLGTKLKSFLEQQCDDGYWDVEEIANGLVKGAMKYRSKNIFSGKEEIKSDDGFEVTTSIHGDEDFVYVIDCSEKTIKCYSHKWDEYEKCIVPEREVEIQEPKAEEA